MLIGRTATARFLALMTAAVLALTLVPPVAAAAGPGRQHGGPVYQDPGRPTKQRVADLLGRMTLAEKVGQMTQAERGVGRREHRDQVTESASVPCCPAADRSRRRTPRRPGRTWSTASSGRR